MGDLGQARADALVVMAETVRVAIDGDSCASKGDGLSMDFHRHFFWWSRGDSTQSDP